MKNKALQIANAIVQLFDEQNRYSARLDFVYADHFAFCKKVKMLDKQAHYIELMECGEGVMVMEDGDVIFVATCYLDEDYDTYKVLATFATGTTVSEIVKAYDELEV